jgi:hypothetical protein
MASFLKFDTCRVIPDSLQRESTNLSQRIKKGFWVFGKRESGTETSGWPVNWPTNPSIIIIIINGWWCIGLYSPLGQSSHIPYHRYHFITIVHKLSTHSYTYSILHTQICISFHSLWHTLLVCTRYPIFLCTHPYILYTHGRGAPRYLFGFCCLPCHHQSRVSWYKRRPLCSCMASLFVGFSK